MKGCHRIHFHLSHIARLNLGGYHDEATAYVCMLLRAIQQCCLDDGAWLDAALLLPEEDPIAEPEFAAEEEDVQANAGYHQARWNLKQQRQKSWQTYNKEGDEWSGQHQGPGQKTQPWGPSGKGNKKGQWNKWEKTWETEAPGTKAPPP